MTIDTRDAAIAILAAMDGETQERRRDCAAGAYAGAARATFPDGRWIAGAD